MKFSTKYTVRWHDTDANRILRPSALLMYMQETANHQLRASDMDLDRLRDERGLGFLLSRISVCVYHRLYAYDEIEVQTWIVEGKGLSFNRCFRVLRGEEIVAEAFSTWGLMDLFGKRLVRQENFQYPFGGDDPISLSLPVRFRLPALSEMEPVGERTIVYSDLDYNCHMNNTHYPDMLCDFTPNILSRCVAGFSLSYLQEAAHGKKLSVYRAQSGDEFLFRTVDEEGTVCLEAKLITRPLTDLKREYPAGETV
ncbi:MAG: hypothetical protein E7620_03795 [Ruminococcaceae bacterium]|nr:hypothetical protein [Oscillospiraceae bacterium]